MSGFLRSERNHAGPCLLYFNFANNSKPAEKTNV